MSHVPLPFLTTARARRWVLAILKPDGRLESRFLAPWAPGGISGVCGGHAAELAGLGAQSWASRSGAMRALRRSQGGEE